LAESSRCACTSTGRALWDVVVALDGNYHRIEDAARNYSRPSSTTS